MTAVPPLSYNVFFCLILQTLHTHMFEVFILRIVAQHSLCFTVWEPPQTVQRMSRRPSPNCLAGAKDTADQPHCSLKQAPEIHKNIIKAMTLYCYKL